jgi:hypothetical protein
MVAFGQAGNSPKIKPASAKAFASYYAAVS